MIERMTKADGGGRVVAVVIALVALSYPFVACWSYLDQLSLARSQLRRLEELQSETEEAKKVENEYFIKELLAQNPGLIGDSTKRYSDIPATADAIFGGGDAVLPDRLVLLTPSSRDLQVFSQMFEDFSGELTARLSESDTVYCYEPRASREGRPQADAGFFVFCRDDVIVAVAVGKSFFPPSFD